jgi:hypothetical protein
MMPYPPTDSVAEGCSCGMPWNAITAPPPCVKHGARYDRHAELREQAWSDEIAAWRSSVALSRRLLRRILAVSYLGVTEEGGHRLYLERDWLDLSTEEAALLALLEEN